MFPRSFSLSSESCGAPKGESSPERSISLRLLPLYTIDSGVVAIHGPSSSYFSIGERDTYSEKHLDGELKGTVLHGQGGLRFIDPRTRSSSRVYYKFLNQTTVRDFETR